MLNSQMHLHMTPMFCTPYTTAHLINCPFNDILHAFELLRQQEKWMNKKINKWMVYFSGVPDCIRGLCLYVAFDCKLLMSKSKGVFICFLSNLMNQG